MLFGFIFDLRTRSFHFYDIGCVTYVEGNLFRETVALLKRPLGHVVMGGLDFIARSALRSAGPGLHCIAHSDHSHSNVIADGPSLRALRAAPQTNAAGRARPP
jgi:hypothetical protein